MKLKNVIQTKLAKTLVAALMIGSISNTGFTVQAEEATQNEQNDAVEMASASGNDSVVAVKEKTYPTIKTVILLEAPWQNMLEGIKPQRMAQ